MSAVDQVALLSLWLAVGLLFASHISARNRKLAGLFIGCLAARSVVAVLQSAYEIFVSNQDAVGYAARGSLIAAWPQDYHLGDVSSNQMGIIATNAFVATVPGPIPTIVMVSLLAALISSFAVVLAVAPYCRVAESSPTRRRVLFAAAALSPSFLFWGSQDLKEPFLMLGVASFVYSYQRRGLAKFFFLVSGVVVCIAYRPYIGAMVLGVGGLFFLARPARRRAPRATLVVLLGVALGVGVSLGPAVTGVELNQQAQYSELAGGGSVLVAAGPFAKAAQFFFVPLPWQIPGSLFAVLPYVESMLLGLLIARYLWLFVRRPQSAQGDSGLVALLLYCTGASVYAAGLANAGTLTRERSPFLLTFLPLLVLSVPWKGASARVSVSEAQPRQLNARRANSRRHIPRESFHGS